MDQGCENSFNKLSNVHSCPLEFRYKWIEGDDSSHVILETYMEATVREKLASHLADCRAPNLL